MKPEHLMLTMGTCMLLLIFNKLNRTSIQLKKTETRRCYSENEPLVIYWYFVMMWIIELTILEHIWTLLIFKVQIQIIGCFFSCMCRVTVPMRDKEKVHDYRFMPEPNLPPLHIYNDVTMPTYLPSDQVVNIDELRRSMPPLPVEVRATLQQKYGISLEHAMTLMVCDLIIFITFLRYFMQKSPWQVLWCAT